MVDMLPAAITAGDLPLEPEALRAFALEQNRLACVLWEQLENLQHQITQLNRARFGASSALVRAALFGLLHDGRISSCELQTQPLSLLTPFVAAEETL